MKISWSILQDVLVSRCGFEAGALDAFAGTLGELFRGSRSMHPLSNALRELTPDIDWSWLHPHLTLDDLAGHFEVALGAKDRAASPPPPGVYERRFSARDPDAHEQTTMWSGEGTFSMLEGAGGQSTGNFASSLALLALLRTNSKPASSLQERLSARAQAIDMAIRADNLITRRQHTASVALLEVTREQVGIAHCGSTLVCRARGGQLDLISADHSLAAEMRRRGHAAPEHSASLMVRVLGAKAPMQPDVHILPRITEDRFWLVSKRFAEAPACLEELAPWVGSSHDPAPVFARLTSATRERFPDARWTLSMLEVIV